MNLDIRKREISYRNLPIILRRHQLWLEDSSKGEKADFSNTYLVGVCFRAEDLRGVNFQGADLFRANLTGSSIHKAIVDKNALNEAIM